MGLQNIAFDAAVDIVDAYGPYATDWPKDLVDTLELLEANNQMFADHLAEMREIEDQLASWEGASDGVEIEDGEDEPGAAPGGLEGGSGGSIEIDPDSVADMDEMLAKFVERQLADLQQPYRVFTTDFDELVDINTAGASLERIQAKTAAAVGPLQKELTRLIAAKSKSVRLPGQRKGRINASSLHRVVAGDDRVFFRKQEAPALNTAISLLIDCSGSMSEGGRDDWTCSAFSIAMQSAFALGTVLNRIGVPFEILGYTTAPHGWCPPDGYWEEVERAHQITPLTRVKPLAYPRFKEFSEPFSLEVQRRLAKSHDVRNTVRMGGTIEGCAHQMAARRLAAQPAERRMMIVLSDGAPGGAAYNGDHLAFARHAADTVTEVAAAGIDVVGVGIGYSAITEYYPDSLVISNVGEMPAKLMGVLKRFLLR